MQLQKASERGLCLPTSFAMALGVPVEELLAEIGEGRRILAFEGLPVPYCWRGVHLQEMIQAALRRGFSVTPVELGPQINPPRLSCLITHKKHTNIPVYHGGSVDNNWRIFRQTISVCSGVLTGDITPPLSEMTQRAHAVAFEKGIILDSDAGAYLYSPEQCEARNFYANCAWRIDKIGVTK